MQRMSGKFSGVNENIQLGVRFVFYIEIYDVSDNMHG